MHFNGRFIVNVADYAARKGADFDQLIHASGHTLKQLQQEAFTVSEQSYGAVMHRTIELTNDPFIGLHVGENLNLAAAGLIGQITRNSTSVKEALGYVCDFANLGCSALPLQLVDRGEYYELECQPNQQWLQKDFLSVRHTAEGLVGFTLREFRALTLDQHEALLVTFPWSAPTDTREMKRIYRCPLHFNSDRMSIRLAREAVEQHILNSDFELLRVLVNHAEKKVAKLQQQVFSEIVKSSMIKLIEADFPKIEHVAHHLNMSVRTLQRRLQQEQLGYRDLLEELRKDFALDYLNNPQLSVQEVAHLLNYADSSAFIRSFKRWTGQTPHSYRVQQNC